MLGISIETNSLKKNLPYSNSVNSTTAVDRIRKFSGIYKSEKLENSRRGQMQLQDRAREVDRVGQDGGQSFRDFLVRRKQNAKQRKSSQRDKPLIYSAKKIEIMTLS